MYRAEYIFPFVALLAGLLFSTSASQALASDTTITLVKQVINDDGGINTPDEWAFLLLDNLGLFEEGSGPVLERQVSPGTYYFHIAGEGEGPLGYTNSPVNCEGGLYTPSEERIDIAEGEHVTCTSVADDIAPTLKLVSIVDGGSASPHDWQLTATGERGFSDVGDSAITHSVKGEITYTLSANGPSNYIAASWSCDAGYLVGNTITLGVGFNAICTITNTYSPPQTPDPVVIIPGILGSWEKNGEWIIDPVLHTYDNLIDTFLANGYVEGETLFKFPYDWRGSNITTAFLLKNKIEDIKEICGCSKVDLISHSMGGLVATAYIERDDYQNDVDQLFLVATPLMGSPEAYKAWEGAEIEFGQRIQNTVMQMIFKNDARKNGYGILPNSVFDYIRGWPVISIQELLPVNKNYLSTLTETLEYPTGYPGNLFLEELIADFDSKVANEVDVRVIRADVPNSNTLNGIVVESSTQLPKWEHGKPINDIFGTGDGTVPLWSIEDVVDADIEFAGTNHNRVASSSTSYIFKEITGEEPDPLIGRTYNIPLSFLSFKLFSPIDIQIIAPDGKRLGKNFENNTELSEIPGAFYSGFNGENEYAIILNPLPGTYEVKTIGTSDGSYTIVADYSDLATTSTAEVTGITALGEVISHTANLSAATTAVTLTAPPKLTPDTCIADMKMAYEKKWITKKAIYTTLTVDCQLLKELFKTRDKLEAASLGKHRKLNQALLKGVLSAIRTTLNSMDKLAKDKSVTKEGKELITKYTKWFRDHEL